MKTYQDLQQTTNKEMFILEAIREHRSSILYSIAMDAEEYDRQRNVTMLTRQKLLYDARGIAKPDLYGANHKICSNFFNRFVNQEANYLLGNGITLEEKANKAKLGKDFDVKVYKAGRSSLVQSASFLFWNMDHVEFFKLTEFVPLYDEETGALMAGIRWWQVNSDKPLRATLYELDGYTEYVKPKGEPLAVKEEKRTYRQIVRQSEADGVEVAPGDNYPGFPIVPMWGNNHHQSELIGLRENIDAYDLIKSGFINELDDVSQIYWILKDCGGMDDEDFARFIERVRATKVAALPDGSDEAMAEPHSIEIPSAAREAALERLKNDMYEDFQAFNVATLMGGQKTATEINAAYTPLDLKTDEFEYCVLDCLLELFRIAGINDNPTFKRNKIQNEMEQTQMVLMAETYLDEETILNKLPWITPEEAQEILKRKAAENLNRFNGDDEELESPLGNGVINNGNA